MHNHKVKDVGTRTRYGYIEAWIGIGANLIIFIIKIIFGLFINSISLIADSFHTLSDVLTSFVVLIGFKISGRPADKEHPFGHGRMEDIATLVIAILLVIVGIELVLHALERIFRPQPVIGSLSVVIMLIATGIVKEWMARFSFGLAHKIESETLIADAWHHRTDAITNILVLIAIVSSRFGYFRADSILGIVVSVIIIFIAIRLAKSSTSHLLGKAPQEEFVREIRKIAYSLADVKGVHDILVHTYGSNRIISLHIEVDKVLGIQEAHKIAASVENKIWRTLKTSAVVHIDLKKQRSNSRFTKTDAVLNKIIYSFPQIISYHGVNFSSTELGDSLEFHIVVKPDMSVEESHNLSHKLSSLIKRRFKDYLVNIHIEPFGEKNGSCSEERK
jgi:cation diffusion facilitator family transporter